MSDYTPVDAEVYEFYECVRFKQDRLTWALLSLVCGILSIPSAYLLLDHGSVLASVYMAISSGVFWGSYFVFLAFVKASESDGYCRKLARFANKEPYYPPLDEWEESLEERGKFAEVELE